MSRRSGKDLLRTPWSRLAWDLLADGRPHSYTEIFGQVMNAVPPSRAIQAYSINKKSKQDVSLEDKVLYGTQRVVEGTLRGKSFIVEDPRTLEKAYPTKRNREFLTIRINPNLEVKSEKPLLKHKDHVYQERLANLTDEEVMEGINRNVTNKAIAIERGLIKKVKTPDGRYGYPVFASKVGTTVVAGFIVINSNKTAEVIEVWPYAETRHYSSIRELFSTDLYSWVFHREAKKEH
jgi:hypothetical protein